MRMAAITAGIVGMTLFCALPLRMIAQQRHEMLCGVIVDENGSGIEGAQVVASGAGFNGWATTKPDGTFCLKSAGAFISVRHAAFSPLLERISSLTAPIRLRLAAAN